MEILYSTHSMFLSEKEHIHNASVAKKDNRSPSQELSLFTNVSIRVLLKKWIGITIKVSLIT